MQVGCGAIELVVARFSDLQKTIMASQAKYDRKEQRSESPSKRHKGSKPEVEEKEKRPTFKVIGKVVMAMRRFQVSLNPTYQYGKRSSDTDVEEVIDSDSHRVIVQPKNPAAEQGRTSGNVASGRTTSGRTTSGRPTSAGYQHGYKGNLLFRPLPKPEEVKNG